MDDGSVGLSEGVRTTVLLREAKACEKRQRELKTRNICKRWSRYVEGKLVITQGREEQNMKSRIAVDACMRSTRAGLGGVV